MTNWNTMKTFELNGKKYTTDHGTLSVLRSIMIDAKATGDGSAVQAVLALGIKAGKIAVAAEATTATIGDLIAKAPDGAHALIIAELHEDTSDSMSDHYGSTVTRTVAIGWRMTKRESFAQMRKAAMAWISGPLWDDHRENYSMGGGNYLTEEGGSRHSSGWKVRTVALDMDWKFGKVVEVAI